MAVSNHRISIRQSPSEPGEVVMLIDGQFAFSLPWQKVDELCRVLHSAARYAENTAAAAKQVIDQAILMRSGSPVCLGDSHKLFKEALKEAQWNSDLRRYMPKTPTGLTVPSSERFGLPSILNHSKR